MAVGEQNHRRVAVTVAIALGGFNQRLDFRRGEVFASAEFGIGAAQRSDCPIYGSWRNDREARLCHLFLSVPDYP
jgi:hypothetical protein